MFSDKKDESGDRRRVAADKKDEMFEEAPPGGYTAGDEVFFSGISKTWENGNRLVYGDKGEVISPAIETTEGKGDPDIILMKGYV